MPQITDITVKKNDGTTNVVYSHTVPAAGDKTPAVWRSNSVGTAAAHRPELRIQSQSNGPKTARRVEGTLTFPSFVTGTDGKVTVVSKGILSFNAVIPRDMADLDVAEFVSQGVNLVASTLVKDTLKTGYAPT